MKVNKKFDFYVLKFFLFKKIMDKLKSINQKEINHNVIEVMKYSGYNEEKAKKEMIIDVIREIRTHQWQVCRCEWYKPLKSKDIEKMLEKLDWDVTECIRILKYKTIDEWLNENGF